jgi:hypothetical protein
LTPLKSPERGFLRGKQGKIADFLKKVAKKFGGMRKGV